MPGLNDKQLEACCTTDGPLLILAGAGSGKTRVITHRIAYLIDEMSVNPYNILAITFTNKAAAEMRERVDNLVGFGAESVWVSTFHSMCVRILRKHIDKIGGTSSFTIYDASEQKTVVKEVLKYLQLDPKLYPERAMLSAISKAKEGYMTPDDYEKEHATSFRDQKIAEVYREYQKRLQSNNALDFDDLIFKTIFLFETNPDVLAEYQTRFKYIMVDEYQDTNHTQFILVKMLAAKYRNLCVVGDDDQSIYKFRGANIYNILNFEEEYPDAKVVKLEQNYRSTANILNAANAVIANNEGRKDKRLWTEQEDGDKITFTRYGTEYEEATGVASRIKTLKNQGISLDDIAVLYRTNAQSRVLEEKLLYENLPYKIYGGQNFYGRKEIMDLVSYLKVLANPIDDQAVKRIINVPKRGIGATTVDKLDMYAQLHDYNLYDALLDIEEVPGMTRNVEKIRKFTDMMEGFKARLVHGEFISEVFDAIMDESGYRDALTAEATDEARARLDNLEELKNKIVTYEESNDEPTLTGLLEDIALVADTEEEDEDGMPTAKVTLMTLHSAKGLEFPYVFITGMEERLFPSGMSLDSDDPDALEEERRLCYVGITRAMVKLYLTAAGQRMVHGSTNFEEVSRFVKEIPKHYLEYEEKAFGYAPANMDRIPSRKPAEQVIQLKAYGKNNPYTRPATATANPSANPGFGKAFPMGNTASAPASYEVGDKVRHIKFGNGEVIDVIPSGGDQEIVVNFDRVGEKHLFASLVKMKKL